MALTRISGGSEVRSAWVLPHLPKCLMLPADWPAAKTRLVSPLNDPQNRYLSDPLGHLDRGGRGTIESSYTLAVDVKAI